MDNTISSKFGVNELVGYGDRDDCFCVCCIEALKTKDKTEILYRPYHSAGLSFQYKREAELKKIKANQYFEVKKIVNFKPRFNIGDELIIDENKNKDTVCGIKLIFYVNQIILASYFEELYLFNGSGNSCLTVEYLNKLKEA